MSRHYKVLTSIRFLHNYYADGICGDFAVKPTPDTALVLPKYRLLWGAHNKHRTDSYQLLHEHINDTTPLIALPSGFELRFEMHLKTPALLNFTDLPRLGNREIFFFENQANGLDLMGSSFRKMGLVGDLIELAGLPAMVTVTVTSPKGEGWTVNSFEESGLVKARIDLEGKPVGIYQLAWPGGTREAYRDPWLVDKSPFGILHLRTPGTGFSPTGYKLSFTAKSVRWKYYLMLKPPAHTGFTYEIRDEGNPRGASFMGYSLGETDPSPSELKAIRNDATLQAFISTSDIPYQDVARSSIRLVRTKIATNTETVLVNDLPNPEAGAMNPAVVVPVDSPHLY